MWTLFDTLLYMKNFLTHYYYVRGQRGDLSRCSWFRVVAFGLGLFILYVLGLQSSLLSRSWSVIVVMRPCSSIQAIILSYSVDDEGEYIPLRVEKNSWVSLMLGKTGGHAKDATKHGGAGIAGCYKAKVIDFRLSHGMKSIVVVQVQHAYMRRQLDLDPTIPVTNATCNCRS
jgi:hypothetical protein